MLTTALPTMPWLRCFYYKELYCLVSGENMIVESDNLPVSYLDESSKVLLLGEATSVEDLLRIWPGEVNFGLIFF